MNTVKHKILLAIDPLDKDFKPSRELLAELRYWVAHLDASVEAAYVLSEPEGDLKINEVMRASTTALENAVQKLHLAANVSTKVIVDRTTSRRHAVASLIKYAKENKATMICVSSQGRKGISRLAFGSFAESLLADSPIPVLFLGLHPLRGESVRKMLFPTDFSEESLRAYETFLKQMAPLKPEVIILHVIPPLDLVYEYSLFGSGAYIPKEYLTAQKKLLVKEGELWVEIANNWGIKAKFIIVDQTENTPEAINKIASEERIALIGIASPRMGKIAKNIFRTKKHSVWVYGPTAVDKALHHERTK